MNYIEMSLWLSLFSFFSSLESHPINSNFYRALFINAFQDPSLQPLCFIRVKQANTPKDVRVGGLKMGVWARRNSKVYWKHFSWVVGVNLRV